ncbi:hypothetical protein DC31_02090 [Microbacterium sp. CH12i]|nr:hypothetical protein DC31_02090 [Microbacterium sp. CH12i]
MVFAVRDGRAVAVGIHYLHETHASLPRAEHALGVCEGACTQHVHDQVVRELIVRPRVIGQRRSLFLLVRIHESWPASSRAQCGGQQRLDEQVALVVEHQARALLPVLPAVGAERAILEPCEEPRLGALRVEQITDRPRLLPQLFHRALGSLIDKVLGRLRPCRARLSTRLCACGGIRVIGVDLGRLSQSPPDCVELRRGQTTVPKRIA